MEATGGEGRRKQGERGWRKWGEEVKQAGGGVQAGGEGVEVGGEGAEEAQEEKAIGKETDRQRKVVDTKIY